MVLIVLLAFFENVNLLSAYRYNVELNKKRATNARLEKEIEETRQKTIELTTNREALERFAREEYFMQKEGETVFEFVEK